MRFRHMNFSRHTGVQESLRGCYMHREGQECHNRDKGCAWGDEAALYRPPCHSPQGLRPTEGPHGSGFSMVPPTEASRPGDRDTTGGAFGRQSSQPDVSTIRHSRAREWVGVLESLLTSLPHAAQNGCSNGRSLEKLLQTYSNEPKRLGVKPHETMLHFACEMLVNRTCSSLGSVRI